MFHGDLTVEEAQSPNWDAAAELISVSVEAARDEWGTIAVNYEPASPSIFKFVCRNCGKVIYQLDTP